MLVTVGLARLADANSYIFVLILLDKYIIRYSERGNLLAFSANLFF